jgi:hypothetical protein
MRTLMLVVLLAVVLAAAYWAVRRGGQGRGVLTGSRSLGRAPAVAPARWRPTHRQADGTTEVVLQRVRTDANGEDTLLEERPFTSWADDDPMWEARFAEAMANARYRCELMNAEES